MIFQSDFLKLFLMFTFVFMKYFHSIFSKMQLASDAQHLRPTNIH